MKKKFFGVTLIVALVVVAAFNINLNKSNNKGNLAMANVEALADTENNCTVMVWTKKVVTYNTLFYCCIGGGSDKLYTDTYQDVECSGDNGPICCEPKQNSYIGTKEETVSCIHGYL